MSKINKKYLIIAAIIIVYFLLLRQFHNNQITDVPLKKNTVDSTERTKPVVQNNIHADTITILTIDNRARLCPYAQCGQDEEILRILTGTKLKVEDFIVIEGPMYNVIWYKVKYKGKEGWVSEFDTDKASMPAR
ncbi:hypothetical protein LLH00_11880 [bacterium]|nr:hypothetical protein [bacterium]